MQESGYKLNAVNNNQDFGIAQINQFNIKGLKLSKYRLLNDLQYSIDAGGLILSKYSRFAKKEPNLWWTRYNCGNRSMSKIQSICVAYQSKVQRYIN